MHDHSFNFAAVYCHVIKCLVIFLFFCRTTASAWDKFMLLTWKNWIIQIRHPVQTIFEILVPVLVCALVILIRGLVDIEKFGNDFKFSAQLTTQINPQILNTERTNLELAFSPTNPLLGILVQNVATELNLSRIIPMENSTELENFAMAMVPFASIEFEDILKVSKRKIFLLFQSNNQNLPGCNNTA